MDTWDGPGDTEGRAASGPGGQQRLTVIVSAAAAAVMVAGAATAAVALTRFPGGTPDSLNRSPSRLTAPPSVTAAASVTPPVAAGSCAQPTAFSYSGTLSAAFPAVFTYRWVYSAGKPGPVQTVRFARAGHQVVAGQTVAARKAGGGWAELKVISPVARVSNKAAYRLLCGGGTAGGISVTAAVSPATRTAADSDLRSRSVTDARRRRTSAADSVRL